MSRRKRTSPDADAPAALTSQDLYLFNEGSHFRLYDKLGAHPEDGGTRFAVWAPDAREVSVIGDFNGWEKGRSCLEPAGDSGIWHGYIPGLESGALYKYHIRSRYHGYVVDKADPCGFFHEVAPKTASVTWKLDYDWGDGDWIAARRNRNRLEDPISIYEVHLGSWRRVAGEGYRSLHYREIAEALTDHVSRLGFTHVEFMPVMEHPFFGSWGYQVTGYFAPSSRYGTPQDFMYLVDTLHRAGIGVILDWVPSHFPNDEHGLGFFDGTHLYEHADPRLGFHPDWKSYIFNYGRPEVRSFLISSALFWMDRYHADGLRVDGVASMLYLDYSRQPGEWVPNRFGGRENLDAITFLRRFNEEVYRSFPDVQTYAEESTAWPMVSRPTSVGGLGFGLKWDMGWMHDTLRYLSRDPVYRRYHQGELTFRMIYAFNENFVLGLSHDEVVYGKGSLVGKMPGDDWQKFANLRLLYGYQFTQPGKKLLFMGAEFAQWSEWRHDGGLDWDLLAYDRHQQMRDWLTALNRLYRSEPALHQRDCRPDGFEWVDTKDELHSIISYLRAGEVPEETLLVVCNFANRGHDGYVIGAPYGGNWMQIANSDDVAYGGGGRRNALPLPAEPKEAHGHQFSIRITIPPLAMICFSRHRMQP